MALMTRSGRTALAISLKDQPIHLAWGTGDASWETQISRSASFAGSTLELEHRPIKDFRMFHESMLLVSGEDYTVDLTRGLVTWLNAPAPETVLVTYTVATPLEALETSDLLNEVGRRIVDEIAFCTSDPEGLLITPTGRFSATTTPTHQLYFHCTFDFEDASTETIRELGLFMGTQVLSHCPPGQRYFRPEELEDSGILLVCENTVPLIRTPATREAFSFVVTL